jgi:hypothetical protein
MTMTDHQAKQPESPRELYVHRRGQVRVTLVSAETDVTIATAVGLAEGESVWMEESEVELDATTTIAEEGIPHRAKVHVGRCKKVATKVTYNGTTKERSFNPAAKVERVFDWAASKRGFDLAPTDAADHELQIGGTSVKPDASDHVGSFVDDNCAVVFSLVPKIRNEG